MRFVIMIVAMTLNPFLWAADCERAGMVGGVYINNCDTSEESLLARAEQGDKTAQYQMAMAYLEGKENDQSLQQAADWFRQSADQGVLASQYQLGLLYAEGKGIDQDMDQAVALWTLAAWNGYALAQIKVADSFASGDGLQGDPVQAYVWYALAVSSAGGTLADEAAVQRDAIAVNLTEEQLAAAEEQRGMLYQQILMNKLMQKARP